ncbi:hypothetical protein MRB53_010388 [Persea americana]|uniref:Uncharacterized protein n=1 Tax=Persea americana TaxID=3435 RepID=A0ACC2LRT2_PERAE|nr:hypothetical protein MRB53_010388 [Persea americana]
MTIGTKAQNPKSISAAMVLPVDCFDPWKGLADAGVALKRERPPGHSDGPTFLLRERGRAAARWERVVVASGNEMGERGRNE